MFAQKSKVTELKVRNARRRRRPLQTCPFMGRSERSRMNFATNRMKKLLSIAATFLCSTLLLPGAARAQKPADAKLQPGPATTVTVDGSEAMFTTIGALPASGFEADVSAANWSPMRAQLRERMQHQQGPAVEVMRNFYKQHELADAGQMPSRYIWFGLISGPAPKFEPVLRRDELPPEVIALEGLQETLSRHQRYN